MVEPNQSPGAYVVDAKTARKMADNYISDTIAAKLRDINKRIYDAAKSGETKIFIFQKGPFIGYKERNKIKFMLESLGYKIRSWNDRNDTCTELSWGT